MGQLILTPTLNRPFMSKQCTYYPLIWLVFALKIFTGSPYTTHFIAYCF